MNSFLYVEDLVANALIENIERNHCRHISLDDLEKYAAHVVRWWSNNYHLRITILNSQYYINKMLKEFSNFFEMIDAGESCKILLKDKKTVEDCRENFRSYLSTAMLTSFIEAFDMLYCKLDSV